MCEFRITESHERFIVVHNVHKLLVKSVWRLKRSYIPCAVPCFHIIHRPKSFKPLPTYLQSHAVDVQNGRAVPHSMAHMHHGDVVPFVELERVLVEDRELPADFESKAFVLHRKNRGHR